MRVAFIVFTGLCVAFSVLLPRIDESLRVHRALTGISEAGGIWKVLSDTDLQANYTSKPEFSSTPVRQTQVLALPQVAKSSAAIEQLREAGGVDALELDISQLSPDDWVTLAALPKLRQLICYISNAAQISESLRHLAELKSLRVVVLDAAAINDEHIDILMQLRHLQMLSLRNTSITRNAAHNLRAKMREVSIGPIELFLPDDVFELVQSVRGSGGAVAFDEKGNLTLLRLQRNADETLQAASRIEEIRQTLRHVILEGSDVSSSCVEYLGALNGVNRVNALSTQLSAEDVRNIAQSLNCQVLCDGIDARKMQSRRD